MSGLQQQSTKALCALLLTCMHLEGVPRWSCFLQKLPLKHACQELLAQCRRGFRCRLCFFPVLYICLFQDWGRNQQENKTNKRLRPPHWCSGDCGTLHHQCCSPTSQEQVHIQTNKPHSAAFREHIPSIILQIRRISMKSYNTAER